MSTLTLKERVERLLPSPYAEVVHNVEAGTIVISEWHSDLDPPAYIIPEHAALKFARWLATKHRAFAREGRQEAKRLTTPADAKKARAAYRAWEKKYAKPAKPTSAVTRAPNGKHTYHDMIASLHKLQAIYGRDECFRILRDEGDGAKSVRDVCAAHYDAVTEAANELTKDMPSHDVHTREDRQGA